MQPFTELTRRGQLLRLRRLALDALAAYDLPQPQLRAIKHEHNTTFRVVDANDRQYVLRIHRPGQHGEAAIASELAWLAALGQETELCVPQPVGNVAGALYASVAVEGVPEPRVCVLFRWQAGSFVNERLTPAHLQRVGTLTACLHKHAAHWQSPQGFVRGRVDNLTAETRHGSLLDPHTLDRRTLSQHPNEEDADRAVRLVTDHCSRESGALVARGIAAIRRMHEELGHAADVFGLIHADLHQDNYLFCDAQQDGGICAIDFDDCGYGHFLFDLNVTLLEVQHLRGYSALRAALLEGYRRVRPLSPAHEAYLPTFFVLRHVQLLTWIIQSREHPSFRAWWQEDAQEEIDGLRHLLKE